METSTTPLPWSRAGRVKKSGSVQGQRNSVVTVCLAVKFIPILSGSSSSSTHTQSTLVKPFYPSRPDSPSHNHLVIAEHLRLIQHLPAFCPARLLLVRTLPLLQPLPLPLPLYTTTASAYPRTYQSHWPSQLPLTTHPPTAHHEVTVWRVTLPAGAITFNPNSHSHKRTLHRYWTRAHTACVSDAAPAIGAESEGNIRSGIRPPIPGKREREDWSRIKDNHYRHESRAKGNGSRFSLRVLLLPQRV